jgi:Homeodomain-like domain
MQERDGRSIADAALEVLRESAVAMHEAGNAQLAIARALGVHKNTVCRWLEGWRVVGAAAAIVAGGPQGDEDGGGHGRLHRTRHWTAPALRVWDLATCPVHPIAQPAHSVSM